MKDDERRLTIDTRTMVAVLLVVLLALVAHARIAINLTESGRDAGHAIALARLVVLPLLLAVVLWLLGDRRRFIFERFAPQALTARILITGIVTGVLMRIASWSQITAFGAFGRLDNALAAPPKAFGVGFQCPSFTIMAAALATWLVLVPLVEEVVHRGVIQSWLVRHGKWAAIVGSTLIFSLVHEPSTFVRVALMGLILGIQYWNSRYLWLPLLAHASYDGLIPLDELCLQLAWNPPVTELPLPGVALPAAGLMAGCILVTVWLSREARVGPPWRRPDPVADPVADRPADPPADR